MGLEPAGYVRVKPSNAMATFVHIEPICHGFRFFASFSIGQISHQQHKGYASMVTCVTGNVAKG